MGLECLECFGRGKTEHARVLAGLLLLVLLVLGYPATREHLARWRGGRYHRFCPRYHLQ